MPPSLRARNESAPSAGAGAGMTKKARRMLALMDRATTLWHIPVVGRAKGRLIRRLIERHRPTRALEVGSLLGYSAILIAGSMPPRGRLTCLEANEFLAWLVKANVETAGLARRVRVIPSEALRAIPMLPGRFDFALLDADKNDYLAKFVKANVAEAGLGSRVRVVVGDALRAIPLLPGRFDFVFIDARKEDYLDYLRQLEPKLGAGAVVVADNTGVFRRDVSNYLEYVRDPSGPWQSREHEFGDDAMEVSWRKERNE